MASEIKIMTLREAIKEAMSEEMRRDENVFLMGEDVGIFGRDLDGLRPGAAVPLASGGAPFHVFPCL